VLTATLLRDGEITPLGDPADISEHLPERPGEVLWVDVIDATEGDLKCIQDEFDLHALAIDDVRHQGQRPKIELYAAHAFVVAYAHDPDPLDLPPVGMFVGERWLITVRSRNAAGRAFEIEGSQQRFVRRCGAKAEIGFLLYTVLDEMVDGYFTTVDEVEDRIANLEELLFESYGDDGPQSAAGERAMVATDHRVQGELLHLRKVLIALRRKVVPLRDVMLVILRREISVIEDETILYFQDVLDHLLRIVDEIDTQRELLGNVVDAHLALVANRTNSVMKKTSGWGAILIVATLIAGIYGMNFRHMPELTWRFGYLGALGVMLVVTGGLYVYFKRKGWL
jgi:magnesium transporter